MTTAAIPADLDVTIEEYGRGTGSGFQDDKIAAELSI